MNDKSADFHNKLSQIIIINRFSEQKTFRFIMTQNITELEGVLKKFYKMA